MAMLEVAWALLPAYHIVTYRNPLTVQAIISNIMTYAVLMYFIIHRWLQFISHVSI